MTIVVSEATSSIEIVFWLAEECMSNFTLGHGKKYI
jgi:hypothetical protein